MIMNIFRVEKSLIKIAQDQNYSFQKQIGQKCCFVPLRTRFHHIRPQFYDLTLPKKILRSPNHSGLPTGKTHKPIQINENDG